MIFGKKGFSIGEALAITGIVGVLSAIGGFSIASAVQSAQTVSADECARQIYVSAQEGFMDLKENGLLDEINIEEPQDTSYGKKIQEIPGDYFYQLKKAGLKAEEESRIREDLVVLESKEAEEKAFLNQIIQEDSLENDVKDACYFIEYSKTTGAVYSVFYVDTTEKIPYEKIIEQLNKSGRPAPPEVKKEDAIKARQEFEYNNKKYTVGYYTGGIIHKMNSEKLQKPELRISNREELILNILDPNQEAETQNEVSVEVEITGAISKKSALYQIEKKGKVYVLRNRETGEEFQNIICVENEDQREYKIILDSITDENGNLHFARILDAFHTGIYPGEDVKIQVRLVPDKNSDLLPVKNIVECNSLFENCDEEGVEIGAIRHLENLDTAISGLSVVLSEKASYQKAVLTNDLAFAGTQAEKDYCHKQILPWDGKTVAYGRGSFFPISLNSGFELDGKQHKIINLNILSSGEAGNMEAGLFGKIMGEHSTVLIKNLGIINENETVGIQGPNITHGGVFVGICEGRVEIENCFSVCKIQDTGADRETPCFIGGFVGKGNRVVIKNSYGSGYTKNGNWDSEVVNSTISVCQNKRSVIGGLVGEITGSGEISNSYTTLSIGVSEEGNGEIGGLVGNSAGPLKLKNDYAFTLIGAKVSASSTYEIGGILGKGEPVNLEETYYLIPFQELCGKAYTNSLGTGLLLREAYEKGQMNLGVKTHCFDGSLQGENYSFAEVTGLSHHYGDWGRNKAESKMFLTITEEDRFVEEIIEIAPYIQNQHGKVRYEISYEESCKTNTKGSNISETGSLHLGTNPIEFKDTCTYIKITDEGDDSYFGKTVIYKVNVKRHPLSIHWTGGDEAYDGTKKQPTPQASIENEINLNPEKTNQAKEPGNYVAGVCPKNPEKYEITEGAEYPWKIYICEQGKRHFVTLSDGYNAKGENGVVYLVHDFTGSGTKTKNTKVTFDLNGHCLQSSTKTSAMIIKTGEITTVNGTIKSSNNPNAAVLVQGGTYYNKGAVLQNIGNGSCKSALKVDGGNAEFLSGKILSENATGEADHTRETYGIKQTGGSLKISQGEIVAKGHKAHASCVNMDGGTFNVTGGNFSATTESAGENKHSAVLFWMNDGKAIISGGNEKYMKDQKEYPYVDRTNSQNYTVNRYGAQASQTTAGCFYTGSGEMQIKGGEWTCKGGAEKNCEYGCYAEGGKILFENGIIYTVGNDRKVDTVCGLMTRYLGYVQQSGGILVSRTGKQVHGISSECDEKYVHSEKKGGEIHAYYGAKYTTGVHGAKVSSLSGKIFCKASENSPSDYLFGIFQSRIECSLKSLAEILHKGNPVNAKGVPWYQVYKCVDKGGKEIENQPNSQKKATAEKEKKENLVMQEKSEDFPQRSTCTAEEAKDSKEPFSKTVDSENKIKIEDSRIPESVTEESTAEVPEEGKESESPEETESPIEISEEAIPPEVSEGEEELQPVVMENK